MPRRQQLLPFPSLPPSFSLEEEEGVIPPRCQRLQCQCRGRGGEREGEEGVELLGPEAEGAATRCPGFACEEGGRREGGMK